jgi:putative phosphoesterase
MILGVVSDTHGHLEYTRQAIRTLQQLRVEAVLHCGDIGSTDIPTLFGAWPTHFVLGNVDYDPESLERSMPPAGTFHGHFADLTIASRRIAIIHSDDFKRFRGAIDSGEYDLVCYGHTHTAEQHLERKTIVLNPGALYRATPHSLATVDLTTMTAKIVNLPS